MRHLFAVIALFVSLILSCVPYHFEVDPRFPDGANNQEIQDAARDWNKHLDQAHQIVFRDGAWVILREHPPQGFNGECSRKLKTIWIHPEPGGGVSIYAIALHEFGHAVGLKHTETGVMMARTVSVEFTPEVLAECRRAGACL